MLICDAIPNHESSLNDLSEERFRLTYLRQAVSEETIRENNRSIRHQLASLRLYDLRNDCPTNAGLIVLCDSPVRFLPGAYVQFVRYSGVDEASEVIFEKRAEGDLRTLLSTLDLLMDVNTRQWPVNIGGFREETRSDYPRLALREVRADNFPQQVAYRNPVIVEAARALGYANRFGMGVIRAGRALEQNGNPAAQFRFDAAGVDVLLYSAE